METDPKPPGEEELEGEGRDEPQPWAKTGSADEDNPTLDDDED